TIAEPLMLNGMGIGGGLPSSSNGALAVGGFLTCTGPISLASDAAVSTVFTGNLTVNTSSLTLNGHTLPINSAGTSTFHTPIVDGVGGRGSLGVNTALTTGTANLTAANTYTGNTYIKAGILNLSGNGTLASTDLQVDANVTTIVSGFPGPAGILQLDNGTTFNADRLPDTATLTLTGGAFSFLGRNAAVATTETIGALHLARGQSFVRSVLSSTVGATSTLTIGSLVRDPGTTVDFTGPNLGTASNRILVGSAPSRVGNNGGILPFATYTPTTFGTPTPDFATYDSATGIKQFTGYVTSLALAGPGDIVKLDNAVQTLAPNLTIGALLLRNNSTVIINPNATLTLSNGLLTSGFGTATIQPGLGAGSAPTLSFDGNEGLITRFMQTNLNTVITGSGGLVIGGL